MSDDKVVSIEDARFARLPMLDLDLRSLQALVQSFVHQVAAMGHREVCSSFKVGKYTAEIDLKIKENA